MDGTVHYGRDGAGWDKLTSGWRTEGRMGEWEEGWADGRNGIGRDKEQVTDENSKRSKSKRTA